MAKVFAITNQKGGVGKTTTTVNLAASLAATKRRILLIDLDPQGNATMGCGVDKDAVEFSVYDVLVAGRAIGETVQRAEDSGFDVLPANQDLTAAEVELINEIGREFRLKEALQAVTPHYDYVLIDCPPSLNMLTVNALAAADGVLIPMQCEYYALEGLSALLNTINRVKQLINPALEVEGILRTMYDGRTSLTSQVTDELRRHFDDKVYSTVIPRNVRLAEAPSHGLPVLYYDKQSKGALAYLALAGEILRRASKPSPEAEPDNNLNTQAEQIHG
ncbi:ParA family protein [Spongiibacter taiwanensis]|uniref:ParA family protein n=1 Tax=Spongiibacter taiwanensis TaxID=1748242 RepID=UPI0020363E80|nr:ParA family protein [Spongiibacter taiwanensis]USA41810.1 ParA family protein [Spongiibacter taiwanensis]